MNFMEFRQLKGNDEMIVHFRIEDACGYISRDVYNFLCPKDSDERKIDVLNAIEYTLHCILDEGGDSEDVERFTGLVPCTGNESEIYVDLDYVIPGSPCYLDFHSEHLREVLYERFKLHWIADHGYTVESLIKSVMEYADEVYDIYTGSYEDLACEWEYERGFDGTLYPCFNEFVFSEYQDKELAKLLCQTEEEYRMYLEDPMVKGE